MAELNLGRVVGSKWYNGTSITGTSTSPTAFTTGITMALPNDQYLNSQSGNIYQCVEGGNEATAKWVYKGNINVVNNFITKVIGHESTGELKMEQNISDFIVVDENENTITVTENGGIYHSYLTDTLSPWILQEGSYNFYSIAYNTEDNFAIAVGGAGMASLVEIDVNNKRYSDIFNEIRDVIFRDVHFADGKFIAVGDNSCIIELTKNGNYTCRQVSATNLVDGNNLKKVIYGNGVWVSIGDKGFPYSNVDITLWARGNNVNSPETYKDLTFGNNKFIAVGNGLKILYSHNGIDWNEHTITNTSATNIACIAYVNGYFIACSDDGKFIKSDNGTDWKDMSASGYDINNGGFLIKKLNTFDNVVYGLSNHTDGRSKLFKISEMTESIPMFEIIKILYQDYLSRQTP